MARTPRLAVLQVEDTADEVALESPGDLRVQWHRGDGDERVDLGRLDAPAA